MQRFRDIPPPFVISPRSPAPGGLQPMHFGFTVYGQAAHHVDLLLDSWHDAAQTGLDPGRIPTRLTINPLPSPACRPATGDLIGLVFTTPLLLKRHGRVLEAGEITTLDLFNALARRLEMTRIIHGLDSPLQSHDWQDIARQCQAESRLKHVRYTRYSNHQARQMPLEGATGTFWIQGRLPMDVWHALQLGQWLHIGGKTALGLGCYHLVDPSIPQLRITSEDVA